MRKDIKTPKTQNFFLTNGAIIPDVFYHFMQIPTDFEVIKKNSLTIKIQIPEKYLNNLSEVVPCFSSLQKYSYRASLNGKTIDNEDVSATLEGLGDTFPKATCIGSAIKADVDTFVIATPCSTLTLSFEVFCDSTLPWIASFSLRSNQENTSFNYDDTINILSLSVPALSQFDIPEIGSRICSPTSVAMLLKYFEKDVTAAQVAELAYMPSTDLYGVWPAAIYAANQLGAMGMLLRFDSMSFVELLQAGYPFAASIRYGKDELTNAAIEHDKVSGHLVVITGIDHNKVFVADPAAKKVSEVCREYNLDEFLMAWLSRAAVAYVLF